jgi:outer membrane protein
LNQRRTSTPGRMTEMFHKVAQISPLLILSFSISAVAQLNVAKQAPTNVPNGALDTTFRIATINMQQTIIASNEGRRDFEALSLKFQPKEAELKRLADEIDGLKKQLDTQQSMLNDEARGKLMSSIESKQKNLERATQDAQEDFESQRRELVSNLLTKLGPVVQKYFNDNHYSLLLDTSQPWPQGPVVMAGPAADITQQVLEAYNIVSGGPASAPSNAPAKPAKPPATKPAGPQ